MILVFLNSRFPDQRLISVFGYFQSSIYNSPLFGLNTSTLDFGDKIIYIGSFVFQRRQSPWPGSSQVLVNLPQNICVTHFLILTWRVHFTVHAYTSTHVYII